jgi:uncharacterized protein (TIGR02246 family)
MQTDEQKIRVVIATWLQATKEGDIPRILSLMSEDAVFLMPGMPPIRGREAYAALCKPIMPFASFEAKSELQEIKICGDYAWCWGRLSIAGMPKQGDALVRRSGPVLSIFQKQPSGDWVLIRDANMLTVESAH